MGYRHIHGFTLLQKCFQPLSRGNSRVAVKETRGPTKPQIFIVWLLQRNLPISGFCSLPWEVCLSFWLSNSRGRKRNVFSTEREEDLGHKFLRVVHGSFKQFMNGIQRDPKLDAKQNMLSLSF